MQQNIIAITYLLIVGTSTYTLLRGFSRNLGYYEDLNKLFGYWLFVTSAAFLSFNYWLFTFLTFGLLIINKKEDVSFSMALFFFLFLSLPSLDKAIPFFGLIDRLFSINWQKIVTLGVLLPIVFKVKNNYRKQGTPLSNLDKMVSAFLICISLLSFRDTSFTEGMRQVFYFLILLYIPYYVLSRGVDKFEEIIRIQHSIYIVILIMSAIGVFSTFKVWYPYSTLNISFDLPLETINNFKFRAGFLRADSVYGPINLGLFISLSFAIGLFLHQSVRSRFYFFSHGSILLSCLILTFSRGPWVGFAAMLVVYFLLAKHKVKVLLNGLPFFIFAFLILAISGFNSTIVELLPFVGSASEDTVSYRELLFTVSLRQVSEFPFFGSTNFLSAPRMQVLIQGEGMIDVVNTYLQIALQYGYVSLFLFVFAFFGVPLKIYSYRNKVSGNASDIGGVLLAMFVVILIVIGTVSSLQNSQVLPIMFAVLGLGVAYLKICDKELANTSI